MVRIHTQLIGEPQTVADERGEWRSAIFRQPADGPVELRDHGLVGDQVADTKNHGKPDQAVCCHPLDHYAYWNELYENDAPDRILGPGSVGENWTLTGVTEHDISVGDVFSVGSARVQVSGPRQPCTKQERKLKLPGFHRRTIETLRTGFYLWVLKPGPSKPVTSGHWKSILTRNSLSTALTSVRINRSPRNLRNERSKRRNWPRDGSVCSSRSWIKRGPADQ